MATKLNDSERKNNSMDLLTLSPASKMVPFGTGTVEAHGIPLIQIGPLLKRFPVLLAYLSGQAIEPSELLAAAPDAANAVMAAGLKAYGDVAAEASLDRFALGHQLDLLSAIMDLTLTGESIGPFLALVAKLGAASQQTLKSASKSASQSEPDALTDDAGRGPSETLPNSLNS
jgi:hypothetical protein